MYEPLVYMVFCGGKVFRVGIFEKDMDNRLPIPAKLKRKILVEAGHRCAIPTCRTPTIEIAHIEPWSKSKEHKYEELIALCPNCHTRADKGEIDRKSLKIYKRILQKLTDRYEKVELNILNELRQNKRVVFAGNMLLLIKNLLDDGLVTFKEWGVYAGGIPINIQIFLTDKGKEFIEEWISANENLTY